MDEAAESSPKNRKAICELIVSRLNDRSKRVWMQAAIDLAELGPEYREEILHHANRENASWQVNRTYWLLAAFLAGMMVLFPFIHGSTEERWWRTLLLFAVGVPLGAAAMVAVSRLSSRCVKLSRLVPAVCELHDIRSIEPLIGAYQVCNKTDRERIEESLGNLIDNGHRAAWNTLSPTSRGDLNRYITQGTLIRFQSTVTIQSVLRLFAACGDTSELRTSRQLARKATQPEVRQAALDCAAAIQSRLEGIADDALLLRPSNASGAESSLVRPSIGADTVKPSNLLRPEPETIESVSLKANGSVDG